MRLPAYATRDVRVSLQSINYCCILIVSMLVLLPLTVVDVYALMTKHYLANDLVNADSTCTQ